MTQTLQAQPTLITIHTPVEDTGSCCVPSAGDAACCGTTGAFNLVLSEVDAEQLANIFKALGNPVRLQIVELLSRCAGQVCVCDIEDQFNLSQPTISHHLKVLRQAQIIGGEQQGLWVHYFVRMETLETLRSIIDVIYGRAAHT
jgi:ArsR family transcriptional regulator